MRRLFAAALLLALPLALGCQEPPKTAAMDDKVTNLCNLRQWDADMQGRGNLYYDSVMGYGPEIFPVMVDHLTDENVTAIYDEISGRNPKVCDLVLLMLLDATHKKWQDFAGDGLFISTALPNPVFCIKWDRQTKMKVQFHFKKIIETLDDEKK